jgi:hypothetical protein
MAKRNFTKISTVRFSKMIGWQVALAPLMICKAFFSTAAFLSFADAPLTT